jgi:hypothetical protein
MAGNVLREGKGDIFLKISIVARVEMGLRIATLQCLDSKPSCDPHF